MDLLFLFVHVGINNTVGEQLAGDINVLFY